MRAGCDAESVQRVFATNLAFFETIEVAGVPFDDRAAATKLRHELCDGRADFPSPIPENPEILEEPAVSGYFGLVTRADLPPEFAEALFRNGVGEIVGPVAYDGRYWVFQILMPKRAEINRVIYEHCETLIGE